MERDLSIYTELAKTIAKLKKQKTLDSYIKTAQFVFCYIPYMLVRPLK